MALKVSNSCEIEDIREEVMRITSRGYDEVERAFENAGLTPENSKTFISLNSVNEKFHVLSSYTISENENLEWLDRALFIILSEARISSVYITNEI